MGKALGETRTLSALLVTVVILWFVTADAARSAIVLRNQARELAAWLSVRDVGRRFVRPLEAMADRERKTTFTEEFVTGPQGGEGTREVAFTVRLPWQGAAGAEHARLTVEARTRPGRTGYRAYDLSAEETSLPLASYAIVICPWQCGLTKDGEPAVLVYPTDRISLPSSQRHVEAGLHATVPDDRWRPEPRGWVAMEVLLGARGWTPRGGCEITSWQSRACLVQLEDPIVARFVADGFTASFNVSGVPVSAALYPPAVALVIGLLAFALVGPWLALRAAVAPDGSETWTMMARSPTLAGRALAVVQTLVAVLAVAAPVAVGVSQAGLRDVMTPLERGLWLASLPGLALAVLVLAGIAWELRRLRRLPPASP